MTRTLASLAAILLLGCGPSWMDRAPDDGRSPVPTAAASATPTEPTLARREAFANPGGMWTPQQMTEHADTLRALGLRLDPSALGDPMGHPLGAVVSLGGCSASFVSAEGLIITNHHCVTGALQHNATPDHNLLKDGFNASSRADERPAGPTARVYVTQRFEDVTAKVREGVDAIADPKARYQAVEQRNKELVAACEAGRAESIRCSVVSYYGGASYLLIEQLEIRDVRLVYAPAASVGAFGGEIDNWRWPRHAGDFAFLRAYVGKDGQPADPDPANVPYRPRHHLRLSSTPLQAHDLVMVAGYPAHTTRLHTAAEVQHAVDWSYPRSLRMSDDYIALLERLAREDPELAIKGRRLLLGLSNRRTNTKGMLDGLVQGGLGERKVTLEKELVKATPGSAAAIERLARAHAALAASRDADAATEEAVWLSALLGAADRIVHMAEERPKPDAARHPDYQARNHKPLVQGEHAAQRTYDRRLDKAKLALALERAARLPAAQRPALLGLVVGAGVEPTPAAIDAALGKMYAATELESVERRVALFETATTAELRRSKDPFVQLALKLRPLLQEIEDREHAYLGEAMMARPGYVDALRVGTPLLAPDANRTLRITFGTVRGYRPKPEAPVYHPFTKLSELVAKATGKEPFDAPEPLLAAARARSFGPYAAEGLGEVPVDFLTDLDITGGNSGSPTLNAKGELVGLAFDGNYEAMASDWMFMPDITRSIHVDIRYVLWVLDRVDRAHDLLRELGVKPAF